MSFLAHFARQLCAKPHALAVCVHLLNSRLSYMVEHWDAWEFRKGTKAGDAIRIAKSRNKIKTEIHALWISLILKASDGTRTRDLLITNQSLYQLSHRSVICTNTLPKYQQTCPDATEVYYTGF